jgi:hypothetical protein
MGTSKILGAYVIGSGAEEQINLFTMAIGAGLSANQIKGVNPAYCLRVLRLMSRIIVSDEDGRPIGLCFISTPQVRMNKNSSLNQIYICPIGADGVHMSSVPSPPTFDTLR